MSAGRRACVDGGARRVDVVDDADPRGDGAAGGHAPANVATPLLERQSALRSNCMPPVEHVDHRQRPDPAELDRESTRRDVAPAPSPLRVARHRDEAVDFGSRSDLRDERRSIAREPSSPSLLPGENEPPSLRVVDDRGSGLRERESSSGALRTTSNGPRTWRAAALADRSHEPDERRAARIAQRPARCPADRAALGEKEVQRPHVSTVRTKLSRLRVRSAPRRARGGRPLHVRDRPES
jgi:hypothetical protein